MSDNTLQVTVEAIQGPVAGLFNLSVYSNPGSKLMHGRRYCIGYVFANETKRNIESLPQNALRNAFSKYGGHC
jgi:hypothetical protein